MFFRFSLPSAITSLHQNAIARITDIRLIIKLYSAKANPWKDKAADVVRLNKLIDVIAEGKLNLNKQNTVFLFIMCPL